MFGIGLAMQESNQIKSNQIPLTAIVQLAYMEKFDFHLMAKLI